MVEYAPMHPARVFPETESNAVNRSIAPAFVEETTRTVKVVKVVVVDLAPPEVHVGHLKVAPEVTGRVPLSLLVVIGSPDIVGKPLERGVLVDDVMRIVGKELDRFRPQRRQRLRIIVESDGEAVGLVVV